MLRIGEPHAKYTDSNKKKCVFESELFLKEIKFEDILFEHEANLARHPELFIFSRKCGTENVRHQKLKFRYIVLKVPIHTKKDTEKFEP